MQTFGTSNQILNGVKDGSLFGYLVCDVHTPAEVFDKISWINFPPVIQRMEVTSAHLSSYMKERVTKENIKLPRSTVVQTYNGKQLLLFSPIVKFYLKLGLVITNITKFVQYEPHVVLEDFVTQITDGRISAIESGNSALGSSYKNTGNRFVKYYLP